MESIAHDGCDTTPFSDLNSFHQWSSYSVVGWTVARVTREWTLVFQFRRQVIIIITESPRSIFAVFRSRKSRKKSDTLDSESDSLGEFSVSFNPAGLQLNWKQYGLRDTELAVTEILKFSDWFEHEHQKDRRGNAAWDPRECPVPPQQRYVITKPGQINKHTRLLISSKLQ